MTSAGTVVFATLALAHGAPLPVALALLAVGGGLGLGRLAGAPLIELPPTLLRWSVQRVRPTGPWTAPIPLTGSSAPPALAGQHVLAVDPARHDYHGRVAPIAVVLDRHARLVAATLRVTGRHFCLLDAPEQDRLLAAWGDALRPLCRERNAIAQLRWTEWAAPGDTGDHDDWLADQSLPDDTATHAYRALLATAAPLAAQHETLHTLTVRTDRAPLEARHRHDRLAAATEHLLRELRLLGDRLQLADTEVTGPLSPAQLACAVRARLDPAGLKHLDTVHRTLGEAVGHGALQGVALAAEADWHHWRTDDSLHRCFHIATWPRSALPAAWLAPLLLHAGITRAVTVAYEPIAPSASRHTIHRQAAKIESDAAHRAEKGFRVGAEHRWAARAVDEREEELTAGHAELAYTGIIDVAAPDIEQLDHHCAALAQVAASAGILLRPLNGRHDTAAVATLPLARGLAPRSRW
jgi:hypothetical protein